jgi:hypothetical protein
VRVKPIEPAPMKVSLREAVVMVGIPALQDIVREHGRTGRQ